MSGEAVVINEVGLRDGLQNQSTQVSTDGKRRLAELLAAAGIRHMEATSFVSPKAVPQMADAAELIACLPNPETVEYSALIPNEKGYERAIAAGVRSVNAVLSATDTMNRKNIRMSLDDMRAVCRRIIAHAREDSIYVRGYVAVAFECPYEGPVPLDKVIALTGEMLDHGADEVIVADTIGAANPNAVHEVFTALAARFDIKRLSAHFHDTRALALANSWAALQAGVRRFDSSIGGLGGCPFAPGAAGNTATEDLVLMLEQCGYRTGIDVPRLLDAVNLATELTGRELGGRMLPWFLSQKKARVGDAHASAQSG
ncbi:hydroxymethylglutaryl-CoA lyase [Algiphilus sp.]|uniref:hydroxymethylglutaryl-CoA lyase n=1 Tax=Algiphilus sp. TaxID=1872431 RepID=UPI0032EABB7F